jgi:hypothetical protein
VVVNNHHADVTDAYVVIVLHPLILLDNRVFRGQQLPVGRTNSG